MLQSYWTDTGIALRNLEPGPLPPGHARLKVSVCGICGSDLHRYLGEPGTGTPGHEIVGTIMHADRPMPEALYAVEPLLSCGHCEFCLAGQQNLCRQARLIGVDAPGGMAEFVDAPIDRLFPMHPALTPAEASLAEPLAVCLRAVRFGRLRFDSRPLVLGGGTLGLISGLLARETAARVAISVRYPHQAEAARKLGLEPIPEGELLSWARECEPEVIFETVGGSATTLQQAVQACRMGGRIIVLGLFSGLTPVDARNIVLKELEIKGSKIYATTEQGLEFRAGADLLPRFRDELKVLLTHRFPLERVGEAFACAADKKSRSIKVSLTAGT